MNTIVLAVTLSLGAASDPRPFDAQEYHRLIVEQRGKITSMQGTYEAQTRPDELAEQSGAMKGQTKFTRISFAWAGDKRMRKELSEWVGRNERTNKDQSVNVFDGKEFRRREDQMLQIQAPKSAYSELNAYLSGLKWPITEGELARAKHKPAESQYLPYFLEAPNWRVRPKTESVDGTECVVLEQGGGGRRLWLDPKRGYCMLRLEHDKPANGYAQWVNQYRDFREVLPGVFLPTEIVGANIFSSSSKGSKGTLTTTLKVTDLQVNNVPDSVFVLEPSVGDFVVDKTTNQMYRYAPTDDRTLEVSVDQALSNAGYGERRAIWWSLLYLACAVVGGVCLARGYVWLTSRSRKPPQPTTEGQGTPGTTAPGEEPCNDSR
jgi:hypothetical protein